jgi:hypothetical protein
VKDIGGYGIRNKIDNVNKNIFNIFRDKDDANILNTKKSNENLLDSRCNVKNFGNKYRNSLEKSNNIKNSTILSYLKNKNMNNSSSQNYLIKSNSPFFKENLNNSSIKAFIFSSYNSSLLAKLFSKPANYIIFFSKFLSQFFNSFSNNFIIF